MLGWAGRRTRRAKTGGGAPFALLQGRNFTGMGALASESLVSRRGGWNPRGIGPPAVETPQDAQAQSLAEADSVLPARVRWNLSG